MSHAPSLAARLQGWEGQSFYGDVAFFLSTRQAKGEFTKGRLKAINVVDDGLGERDHFASKQNAWHRHIEPQTESQVNIIGAIVIQTEAGFLVA